eukprot:COSAG02_NODE_23889_length_705_cov_0.851485_1_plen_81_part_10
MTETRKHPSTFRTYFILIHKMHAYRYARVHVIVTLTEIIILYAYRRQPAARARVDRGAHTTRTDTIMRFHRENRSILGIRR